MEKYERMAEIIQREIDKYNINAYAYVPYRVADSIFVDVCNGDWKHDHLVVKSIVNDLTNPISMEEVVTDSDGSDTYSARHEFYY